MTNLRISFGLMAAVALLVSVALVGAFRAGHHRGDLRAWTLFYLLGWLVIPAFVVYVTFLAAGVARYSSRYFLFSAPPLAVLVVLACEQVGVSLHLALNRHRERWRFSFLPTLLALLLIAAVILPAGLDAATVRKHDWRGSVRRVVDVTLTDRSHDYIIYETGNRELALSNFYFERFSSTVRAHATVRASEERRGQYRIFNQDAAVIAEHDYLVLLFLHRRAVDFPNLLSELAERYEVRHMQLDGRDRGFIIYRVQGER